MTISIWHKFMPPPWGGGNQFLLALKQEILNEETFVKENIIDETVKSCLINSISFDVDKFKHEYAKYRPRVIHRVDGPVFLIRGYDKDKDDVCFSINNKYASSTVVQSRWMLNKITDMGYTLNNPVIIHNASDPSIFNRNGKTDFSLNRKTKIISTSWSDNPRKGRDTYKWLDDHLNWDDFEYTFVGRIDSNLKNIKKVSPVGSVELSNIIKQHDIYVTASKNDPCSNSLIEALSCGLPSICLNDGGHPELVGKGGMVYDDVNEIPFHLDSIRNSYGSYQDAICINGMSDVYNKYMELLRL